MNYERKNERRTRKKSKNIEKHFKETPTNKKRWKQWKFWKTNLQVELSFEFYNFSSNTCKRDLGEGINTNVDKESNQLHNNKTLKGLMNQQR